MALNDLLENLVTILPVTFLFLWGCVLLLIDAWLPAGRKQVTALLAALGFVVAMVFSLLQMGGIPKSGFNGLVLVDGLAVFLDTFFVSCGLLGTAVAVDYLKRVNLARGEYYILLTFSVAGMMLMSVAADLIIVFLSWELLSIPL